MKGKKILAVGTVVVAVGTLLTLRARADYQWAKRQVAEKSAHGWVLAASIDNFIDPTRPWTWFKTPVTGLWFVKTRAQTAVTPDVYVFPQLRLRYDYNDVEEEETLTAFNIRTHKSAYLPSDAPVGNLDLSSLEWRSFEPNTPGDQLQKFVEASLELSLP